MKKVFGVTLGILTAMGGFVDIGDLVANSETGARFGMSLAWAVLLGVVGIIVYAEMAGRVASVTKRATFDLVRERLGARDGIGEPRRVVLHHHADADRRGRRRGARGAARGRRQLPALDPAGRLRGLDGDLAGEVLDPGDRVRAHGPGHDRRGGRGGAAPPELVAAVAPRLPPERAERRRPSHLLLLRDRAVRRGDDAVRGVLLLVGRGRGEVDALGPRAQPRQRVPRLSPRRDPVARA